MALSKVDGTNFIAPTIPVASGGTGATSFAPGKVLQVVTATDTTQRSTTSTSFVTASNTLTVDITPSATTSKVLILASSMIYASAQYRWLETTIFRGGSNILSSNGASGIYGGADNGGSMSINYLDSPSSTSSLTYDVRLRISNSDNTAYINYASSTGSIIALEIGA
jgi:hypothetical protein